MIDKPQKWAIFDMPPVSKYSSGSITLFGDAAHASTSHAGAGAGMAVEDAFILSELLSDSEVKSIHDVPLVFSSYETMRLPRTQKLVQHSRESGYLYQLRRPGLGDDMEKIKETLGSWQNWIWDIDLESHLEEGRKELRAMLGNCES
jgi:salicylate hydroxylase